MPTLVKITLVEVSLNSPLVYGLGLIDSLLGLMIFLQDESPDKP